MIVIYLIMLQIQDQSQQIIASLNLNIQYNINKYKEAVNTNGKSVYIKEIKEEDF